MPPLDSAAAVAATATNGTSTADSLDALCQTLHAKVEALLAAPTDDNSILRGVQEQVRIANRVVDDALTRYAPHELALSYNGGKDCLVLLLLILARLPAHFSSSSSSNNDTSTTTPSISTTTTPPPPPPPATTTKAKPPFPTSFQALYIRSPNAFPEVDAFVASSTAQYHLSLATSDKPMKPALADYLAAQHPEAAIRAVFVGTRRTDPHGKSLTFFDETDRDWPRFMRIHPVIDWHYREIWGFIRALEVPYCPLYDMGYTSLGGTDDTLPNPALRAHEGKPTATGFRPAYELMDDDEERLGRE
ncbi:FAD synthetase [Microdochium nivale]|nr:FAD synthetase [Microdochium nivale]